MFRDFFKKRKMRVIAFGEPKITWSDGDSNTFSIVFYQNDNGKREYTIKGRNSSHFRGCRYYVPCETWKSTGLLPSWAKDPVAEKLTR